jgi:hypothetical protein
MKQPLKAILAYTKVQSTPVLLEWIDEGLFGYQFEYLQKIVNKNPFQFNNKQHGKGDFHTTTHNQSKPKRNPNQQQNPKHQ